MFVFSGFQRSSPAAIAGGARISVRYESVFSSWEPSTRGLSFVFVASRAFAFGICHPVWLCLPAGECQQRIPIQVGRHVAPSDLTGRAYPPNGAHDQVPRTWVLSAQNVLNAAASPGSLPVLLLLFRRQLPLRTPLPVDVFFPSSALQVFQNPRAVIRRIRPHPTVGIVLVQQLLRHSAVVQRRVRHHIGAPNGCERRTVLQSRGAPACSSHVLL